LRGCQCIGTINLWRDENNEPAADKAKPPAGFAYWRRWIYNEKGHDIRRPFGSCRMFPDVG